jgi:hypothetical protein
MTAPPALAEELTPLADYLAGCTPWSSKQAALARGMLASGVIATDGASLTNSNVVPTTTTAPLRPIHVDRRHRTTSVRVGKDAAATA